MTKTEFNLHTKENKLTGKWIMDIKTKSKKGPSGLLVWDVMVTQIKSTWTNRIQRIVTGWIWTRAAGASSKCQTSGPWLIPMSKIHKSILNLPLDSITYIHANIDIITSILLASYLLTFRVTSHFIFTSGEKCRNMVHIDYLKSRWIILGPPTIIRHFFQRQRKWKLPFIISN